MKKILPFIVLAGIVAMSACGNKAAGNVSQQDSLATTDSVAATDSVATDSLNAEEPAGKAAEQTSEAAEQIVQASPDAKSIEAGGTTITVGAPLAETLKKARGVTFDYNADFGVSAVVGNVVINIPDEDITKEGQDFVNAILADISPNIDFKISYIKPSAKIKDFDKN